MTSLIAQYIPDSLGTYRIARYLGYRAIFSASLFQGFAMCLIVSILSAIATSIILGSPLTTILRWDFIRLLLIVIGLLWPFLIAWRLFNIWRTKPEKDEDAQTEIAISKLEDGIHFASKNGTANIFFEKIIYYFQNDEFIGLKQRYATVILLESKYLNESDHDWLIENLARIAKPMTFWNADKMLHG
jgi:hypothetical protein